MFPPHSVRGDGQAPGDAPTGESGISSMMRLVAPVEFPRLLLLPYRPPLMDQFIVRGTEFTLLLTPRRCVYQVGIVISHVRAFHRKPTLRKSTTWCPGHTFRRDSFRILYGYVVFLSPPSSQKFDETSHLGSDLFVCLIASP